MANKHIENPNRKVMQQVAPVAPVAPDLFLDDDRVTCSNCQHCETRQADEFIDIDHARQLKSMGKRIGMAGDKFEEKGKWLRIHWTEAYCSATGFSPQPSQLKHRCHLHLESSKPVASVESDSWWLN
jgi:hypothetical protein